MGKKRKGHVIAVIIGYLALLTIIMCMVLLITKWINDNTEESPVGDAVETAADVVETQPGITMTQEELDAMLEAAAANAEQDMADAIREASDLAREEVLAGIRAGLESGDNTMVEVIRPYYPDEIVLVSNGQFHFVPIDRSIKMNGYTEDNLKILENGEFQYLENGQVISHKGIDVSSHQGAINWEKVAADGVEFAFIRAAFRGYGSGKLVEDERFESNIEGALANGIHVGVYVYSQAINEAEVIEEADLVLKKLEPYGIRCPIVYDVEKTADSSGRMNQISREERTNLASKFLAAVENAGYTPMMYHNMEMAALMIDIGTFQNYSKWFAYYRDDMYYPYDYAIWQYSDKGSVDGIKGAVDLNISFGVFWGS